MQTKRSDVVLFLSSVMGLIVFVALVAPWLEDQFITPTQRAGLEQKKIDPTDLFYMESETSREIYHEKVILDTN